MNTVRLVLRTCQFAVLAVGTAVAATTPVRIEQTVEPRFPSSLAFSPVSSGEARVMVNIDDEGKLADLLVLGYSNKAFADEAVNMLKAWRYGAATVDGQPVGVRIELRFDFEARGRVVSLSALDTMNGMFEQIGVRNQTTSVCRPRELDQPLAIVQAASPHNPSGQLTPDQPGSVIVDFYVDEQGQPRMPVVLNSPPDILAQAAVGALSQWRFAAPTRHGKPVTVRAQQEFIFHRDT